MALEAVNGEETVAQLGRPARSPPGSNQAWKRVLASGVASVFSNGQEQKASSDATLISRLYQEIGQLKVERDFLAERSGP